MDFLDKPITKKKEDRLSREKVAEHLAYFLNNQEGSDSFVISIEGEWGSGKTSFINLVQPKIDKSKISTIEFKPWNFSSQTQLTKDLFYLLNNEVEGLGESILNYVEKLVGSADFEFNPELTITDPSTNMPMKLSIGKISKNAKSEKDLETVRKELEKKISKHSKKILFVVDDIDRLQREEILAVLKLVKVTANFDNCIFLLSFSRDYVIKTLESENSLLDAEDYLKKIIQLQFRLPNIGSQKLQVILESELVSCLEKFYQGFDPQKDKRWLDVFYSDFPSVFLNIRDVKRYLNSLTFNLSLIGPKEVNIIDLCLLEAIKMIAPNFYDFIAKNRWLFVEGEAGIKTLVNGFSFEKELEKEMEKLITDEKLREKVVELTRELFPKFNKYSMHGQHMEQEWSRQKRVSASSKFDLYFQMVVGDGEISEEEFSFLFDTLAKLKERKSIKGKLKELSKDKKLDQFLRLLHIHFDGLFQEINDFWVNLILALYDGVKYPEEPFSVFTQLTQTHRLVQRIFERNDIDETKMSNVLNSVISDVSSLYLAISLVRWLEQGSALGTERKIKDIKKSVDAARENLKAKIKALLKKDKILNEIGSGQIVFAGHYWGVGEIQDFIKKTAGDKKTVFNVLEWSEKSISSSAKGEYKAISSSSLKHLGVLDETIKTLDGIARKELSGEKLRLFDLFVARNNND